MESDGGDVSSAKAVLLGAVAPGVNVQSYLDYFKVEFFNDGYVSCCNAGLAFSSSEFPLMLHVTFLVVICVSLFLLLSWFLAQTGLVTVEHQMCEMGLVQTGHLDTTRKSQ